MTQMIELTPEQTKAYNKFIALRDRIRNSKVWIRPSEIAETVDVPGLNHPMYAPNPVYIEYQDAFKEWLRVSPHNQNKTPYGANNEA
jgi:hypothetical protein